MSATASAEAALAESTAPQTMLDSIRVSAMESPVVVTARIVRTGIEIHLDAQSLAQLTSNARFIVPNSFGTHLGQP